MSAPADGSSVTLPPMLDERGRERWEYAVVLPSGSGALAQDLGHALVIAGPKGRIFTRMVITSDWGEITDAKGGSDHA